MDRFNWVVNIVLIIALGLFVLLILSMIADSEEKIEVCESNLGEFTSGSTHGCLINNTLYDMTRTKDGWIILNDVYVSDSEVRSSKHKRNEK